MSDLANARLAAPESDRQVDVAEMLVATAVLVGTERALTVARTVVGDDELAAALPYLQPAAFSRTSATRRTTAASKSPTSAYRRPRTSGSR